MNLSIVGITFARGAAAIKELVEADKLKFELGRIVLRAEMMSCVTRIISVSDTACFLRIVQPMSPY